MIAVMGVIANGATGFYYKELRLKIQKITAPSLSVIFLQVGKRFKGDLSLLPHRQPMITRGTNNCKR